MSQEQLMIYDPGFGNEKPWPSHAGQWRKWNGRCAWVFNPWTGVARYPQDIGTDPFGELILTPEESAASDAKLSAGLKKEREERRD